MAFHALVWSTKEWQVGKVLRGLRPAGTISDAKEECVAAAEAFAEQWRRLRR